MAGLKYALLVLLFVSSNSFMKQRQPSMLNIHKDISINPSRIDINSFHSFHSSQFRVRDLNILYMVRKKGGKVCVGGIVKKRPCKPLESLRRYERHHKNLLKHSRKHKSLLLREHVVCARLKEEFRTNLCGITAG